uniref:Voltage-dependent calcium channel gamma-5 subunit n=1 Tax=Daphnia magna TaxID=35525 RepID=A0A0P5RW56_9CRUS
MTVDLDAAIRLLRLMTPLSASLAFVTVAIGLVTSHWLYSEEKMSNPKFNRTGDPELEYLSKFTVSGLWTLCYTNPGETERFCFNIDYFPTEEYSPDPNDSTLSIPYAVLRSAPFFLMATALLVIGEIACFLGHFAPRRRYCTFLSGVTFILSGLLLLLGLVVYVSVFTAEIGSKLRPSSSLQPPMFTYIYGYSFYLVVTGFLAAEVAGTAAIFLFIYWHRNRIAKKEMHRKMTLALVQTPVDLGYTAAHGHLLAIVPPPPPPSSQNHHQHYPMTNSLTPVCLPHCYQDQHHLRHQNETFQSNQCNGFVKIPCPCSIGFVSIGGVASTDDESVSIPTPPPAVSSSYPRDCPVHHQTERSSFVTVHNPAATVGAPPLSTIRRHNNYQKQQSQERDMPDITAFSRMLAHDRRQFSTDSENSSYKVSANNQGAANGNNRQQPSEPLQHQQTTICYQCHGAGHVTVPAISASCDNNSRQMAFADSLPRDVTTSTICSAAMATPGDEDYIAASHRDNNDVDDGELIFHPRHQRNHSTGTNFHGSLRRITAV